MSNLLFGADVRPSAHMAVALINTSAARAGKETLTETELLVDLGREHEIYYEPGGSTAELLGLRGLRDRLDQVVSSPTLEGRMAMLNELFLSAGAIPQIVMHSEDQRPHFHYTHEGASYVDHIRALTAYALSRLIILGEFERIRTCARDDCRLLFFDVTRNGKRLFCNSRTCGNRATAERYRSRHAG